MLYVFAVLAILALVVARWTNNLLLITCAGYSDTQTGNANGVVTQNLPAGACAGVLVVTGLTSHLGGKGFVFSVAFDGGAPTVTGCLDGASQTIPIPAGTAQIVTTVTVGCAGGPAGSYAIAANA